MIKAYKYKYNNKELLDELDLNWYDYSARNYDTALGRFMNLDPLAEKYQACSPYNYTLNNPINFIDPDGRDPIYGKNFWGKTKLIGDDGKEDGKSYLVRRRDKRAVKRAAKKGLDYTGSLIESDNVMKIPTGGVMDDVISSVEDTKSSKKENGGHANIGDANAVRWDEGPAAIPFVDKNGNQGAKAILIMFKINGKNEKPTDASNIEFWWHTHPNVNINGIQLGNSTPSKQDFKGQSNMRKAKYKGNTFVVGVRGGKITFYNNIRVLITVKYSDFKKMGGK